EGARREARVLGFADLELHALRALEHEEVRRHYRGRWKAVLVDEFQDTNPVQARILERLVEDAMLTVVGDEKQSIYGFRGADVGVFRSFRVKILEAGGDDVVLTRTFRSHAGLTGSQEPVFSELLGGLHQPLVAERDAVGTADRYVHFHACVGKGTTGPRRLNEAHLIGTLIRDLVAGGTTIADPDTGMPRPARFGDIAVLARGSAPFDTYSSVLPSLGVPAVEVAGGDLLETREAKDGAAALRFLADQSDSIALVALLRSPFFAVDDSTLARFAATLPKDVAWWDHLAAAELENSLARATNVLAGVLSLRWNTVPSRLLQVLDEATGYSAVVANLPGG